MIVGILLSVYFRVFSLKKHSLQFVGNEGIYNVDKDLVKQNLTFFQTGSFASPRKVSLTHETLAKISSLV